MNLRVRGIRTFGALAFCATAFLLYLSNMAQAQAVGLQTGTYHCFTLSTLYVPNPERTDSKEIARIGVGNIWVRPMVAPQLLLAPAVFGNLVLDGDGNHELTNMREGGRYGFDESTGLPTFSGDLGAMQLIEYSGTGTSFVIGWDGMNFECGLVGVEHSVTASVNDPQDLALTTLAGAALTAATAQEVSGHFEGAYRCHSIQTIMQLDLQAQPDGTLSGVLAFGGLKTPEISYSVGSFALKGTWDGPQFQLTHQSWIVQAVGHNMFSIEGTLTDLGVSGTVQYPTCSVFAALRG